MTSRPPRVTVILPVYNGKLYVREAIQSLLDQTFSDFALLVVDDGSTDGTLDVLNSFRDPRLRIISFPKNQGLVAALNTGLTEARSEFVARMDADDICMPQRFERQVRFLEEHPDVSICGTWMREFGECEHLSCPVTEPEQIHAGIFFGWVMSHPTIMMRRSLLEEHGLRYDEEFRHAEDLDLLIKASAITSMANLPEFLVNHRKHQGQVSAIHRERQREATGALLARQLRVLLPEVTEEEQAFHIDVANAEVPPERFGQVQDWLARLERANLENRKYHVEHFRRGLCRWWFDAHSRHAASTGVPILKSYWTSSFATVQGIGWYNHVAMTGQASIMRLKPARRLVERLKAGTFKHKRDR